MHCSYPLILSKSSWYERQSHLPWDRNLTNPIWCVPAPNCNNYDVVFEFLAGISSGDSYTFSRSPQWLYNLKAQNSTSTPQFGYRVLLTVRHGRASLTEAHLTIVSRSQAAFFFLLCVGGDQNPFLLHPHSDRDTKEKKAVWLRDKMICMCPMWTQKILVQNAQ